MDGLTKGQTVWIHSYTVGHGNNIKLKQSVHTDKEEALESWRLLGGAFNEAIIAGAVTNKQSYENVEERCAEASTGLASVPNLKPVGFLFASDDGAVAYSPADWPMKGFYLIGQVYGDMNTAAATKGVQS